MSETARSEAARLLEKKLAELEWSQGRLTREMSETLGTVPEGLVNHWLHGKRDPDIHRAAWIEEKFGIPARLWATPAKRNGANGKHG